MARWHRGGVTLPGDVDRASAAAHLAGQILAVGPLAVNEAAVTLAAAVSLQGLQGLGSLVKEVCVGEDEPRACVCANAYLCGAPACRLELSHEIRMRVGALA